MAKVSHEIHSSRSCQLISPVARCFPTMSFLPVSILSTLTSSFSNFSDFLKFVSKSTLTSQNQFSTPASQILFQIYSYFSSSVSNLLSLVKFSIPLHLPKFTESLTLIHSFKSTDFSNSVSRILWFVKFSFPLQLLKFSFLLLIHQTLIPN